MSSIPTKQIDGDVTVGRHVTAGGNATVRGNAKVGHNLRVEGWLDAPNIKGPNKGLYKSVTKLREAYPRPQDGWCALVGDTLPAQLYIAENGAWVAQKNADGTPKLAGDPTIDTQAYDETIAGLTGRTSNLEARFASPDGIVSRINSRLNVVEHDSAYHTRKLESILDSSDIVNYDNLPSDVKTYKEFGGMVSNVTTVNAQSISKDGTEDDAMVVYDIVRKRFMLAVAGSDLSGVTWKQQPAYGEDNIFWQDKDGEGNPLLRQNGFTFYNNWGGADRFGTDSTTGKIPVAGRLYLNTGTNVLYRGTAGALLSTDDWTRGYVREARKLLFIDLWIAAGGRYNAETGFFELGSLTDITYEQAISIYMESRNLLVPGVSVRNARATLPAGDKGYCDLQNIFREKFMDSAVESVSFYRKAGDYVRICGSAQDMFRRCASLKEITNPLYLGFATDYKEAFSGCASLVDVRLMGVKSEMWFSDSPELSQESVRYMIVNASNSGNRISLRFHDAVRARLRAHLDPDAPGYADRDEAWDDLMDLAAARNIWVA